ncbi:EF-hand domain-containing protein [Desulfovibrio legallii]|uniref:EF hand n=1 Tax=Desulfovibrio legallii TaxID=571438 RepID=A0A1G7IN37_9BACT|nr:EF-hand domain-containing protein [Desulfovibrio legallii]SDF14152.1 EF hand [Desulfovibrio legallii]
MRHCLACTLTLLALWAAPAWALPGANGEAPKEDTFSRMDTDKSGTVSPQEFKAAFPDMRDEAFAAIDTNKDNVIDRAEWDAFVKNHSAGMMQGMGGQNTMGGQGMMGGDAPAGMPGNQNMMEGAPGGMPLVTPPAGK